MTWEWHLGHFVGSTGDCRVAGAGVKGGATKGVTGTSGAAGGGPNGAAGTGGFAVNLGDVAEPGEKFTGVLLPCKDVAESPPEGEYTSASTLTQANPNQLKTLEVTVEVAA
mgnify:CR=1 FL=1